MANSGLPMAKPDMSISHLTALSLIIVLTGCATHRANTQAVDKGMILPDNAQQLEPDKNQKFLMATPIEAPLPSFPADAPVVARTVICVEFVISMEGTTTTIQQIDAFPGCEAVDSNASRYFYPEVREALSKWTYFGAAMCHYETSESECDEDTAIVTPIPIKLAYRFTFTQAGGKSSVVPEPAH